MIAVGDTGSCIQLLAPLDRDSTIAKFLDRNGPGLQQIAYRVTDVERSRAILRERGLRLLYDEPRRGTADSRINFIHPKDAGGVLVELVEPAATVTEPGRRAGDRGSEPAPSRLGWIDMAAMAVPEQVPDQFRDIAGSAMTAVASDPRLVGLMLGGSIATGTGDAWSDLDLVIVSTDETHAAVLADRAAPSRTG